jgi:Na+/H+ antiporter NhaC
MRRSLLVTALTVLLTVVPAQPAVGQEVETSPKVIPGGVPFSVTVRGAEEVSSWYEVRTSAGRLLGSGTIGAGESHVVQDLVVESRGELPLTVRIGGSSAEVDAPYAPGWYSLLPPLVAIVLALIFREVITALFAGVWLGALAVAGYNPIAAVWRVVDTFAVPALGDVEGGQTQIIVFSLLLGGMVGIIAKNGGTLGIVEAVRPLATTPRRGKIATWLAGLAIFFDDYANTLLVGNTMRPVTDRLRISREKLAYVVDSTAAPVAAMVPISTWVGYEISLIADGFRIAAEQNPGNATLVESLQSASPFTVFLETIPFLFYPILALAFVFLTSFMDRDFGEMARAERRAARGDGLHRAGAMLATDTSGTVMDPKEGAPHRWWNAALPVLTVILVVLGGLYATGRAGTEPGASLMDVLGAADPFATLLWGSLAGCIVAIVLSILQRILTPTEAIESFLGGVRAMMIAMIILVLAWSLGAVTEEVGTAPFLAKILSGALPLALIPMVVFATSAVIAFSTGTSWATMAILVPLVVPLTISLGGGVGFEPGAANYHLLLGSISSVLAGAIFGDHCSPISDTTVLSSMASASDHVDHVRTQLPYALTVALVGMIVGDLGTALGLPNWIALLTGVVILWIVLRIWGQRILEEAPAGWDTATEART